MLQTAATVRRRPAPTLPAPFVVFDVLAIVDGDMRHSLAKAWRPPLQLTHPPSTNLTRRETGHPQYPAWLSHRVVDTVNPERPQHESGTFLGKSSTSCTTR
jgi:hypothetical protein